MSADTDRHPAPPPPSTPRLSIVGGSALLPRRDGTSAFEAADLTIDRTELADIDRPSVTGPSRSPGPRIDAAGLLVAPGLIDIQINGGYGHDLWSDPAGLWDLARHLPRHGVTAFCPTIVSGPPDRAADAAAWLGRRPPDHLGAEPLGLHLEGPMLAPARRGAHASRHLIDPDPVLAAEWARTGAVRLVTLAPELVGAGEVIRVLRAADIAVALGHTEATVDQASEAEAAGATIVTHLFNAMASLHHRRPGLVGHVLGPSSMLAGLIVDGVHVAPEVVALAARALGPDRLVLVSDAVAAMGLPPGEHRLDRRTIRSDERGVRLADGTLAGSNLTLDTAVRNLVAFAGVEPAMALRAATANPARALGLDDRRGRLEPGAVADLVLLDHELSVVATICGGRLAYLDPRHRERVSGLDAPPPAPG